MHSRQVAVVVEALLAVALIAWLGVHTAALLADLVGEQHARTRRYLWISQNQKGHLIYHLVVTDNHSTRTSTRTSPRTYPSRRESECKDKQ